MVSREAACRPPKVFRFARPLHQQPSLSSVFCFGGGCGDDGNLAPRLFSALLFSGILFFLGFLGGGMHLSRFRVVIVIVLW